MTKQVKISTPAKPTVSYFVCNVVISITEVGLRTNQELIKPGPRTFWLQFFFDIFTTLFCVMILTAYCDCLEVIDK